MTYEMAWDKLDIPEEKVSRLSTQDENNLDMEDYNLVAEMICDPYSYLGVKDGEYDDDEVLNRARNHFRNRPNSEDFLKVIDLIEEVGL